ncbi:serine hydrolase (plasmid) [Streptomyces sp. BI20]|uniref:serine hydrolase n=1 Tax=Streptomyces sp. BI20 TaxID=3403460 RepID=UPI003C73C72C
MAAAAIAVACGWAARQPEPTVEPRPVVVRAVDAKSGARPPVREDPQTVLSRELAQAFAQAVPEPKGRFALGVRDVRTDAVALAGDRDFRFDTASVVKSHLLAATLLKAQDEGRSLSPAERRLAAPMIRQSANEPTTALWARLGKDSAMVRAYRRFGMIDTEPGQNFDWGLTTTTVRDQLHFLAMLHDPRGPLDEESRGYELGLMSSLDTSGIEGGVHTIADPDSTYAAKDGWLPRSRSGLWIVNSIGRVPVHGRLLDIVMLSEEQESQEAGVEQGDRALRAIMPRLVRALDTRTG